MIDLTELDTLMKQYVETRERRFPFTLGPLNHQELARLQLDEFMEWLKEQSEADYVKEDWL